jgi:hypothetical protein
LIFFTRVFYAAQQNDFSTNGNQLWLIFSSSILNKLASIIEADPDVLLKSTVGRRMSMRVQERERDRFVGLFKRLAENGLVLLSAVCSIPV